MSNLLPFNKTMINELFTPLTPDESSDNVPGYWILLQGSCLILLSGVEQMLLKAADLPPNIIHKTEPIRIGLWDGKPLIASLVASDYILPAGYEAFSFHGADISLNNILATIAGRAAQILHWERRSRFCSHCGGKLTRIPEGWGKRCINCKEEHYPHIHPCIIVLVRRDKELLLIRNANWSPGRFSLVAGFLEFGESLEECVQREVKEETGIDVTNIRYVGSQCWPFPSQEMIGFLADYAGGDVKPDGVEVVEADWFNEDDLPASLGGKRSIARWIFENYCKSV